MILDQTSFFKQKLRLTVKAFQLCVYGLIKFIFLRNKNYYYLRYLGCDNFFLLIIKNILNPIRIYQKLKYGALLPLPKAWVKGEAASGVSTSESRQLADQFKRDGFVVFHAAHPELADHILSKYANFFSSIEPSNNYNDLILREIDQKILDFIVNEKYLQVIADYYNGRQPYLRATGSLKVTNSLYPYTRTRELRAEQNKFNTGWHYDTVNMVQIHFLLHDLEPNDTHMKLTRAQHRTHRVYLTSQDYYYSDEYIEKYYRVIPVCGKKGTVFIWDSNAPHRAHPVVGRPRSFLQLLYSPGNDILTQSPKFGKDYCLNPGNLDLYSLNSLSLDALKYIINCPGVESSNGSQAAEPDIKFYKGGNTDFEVSNF